MRKAIVVATVSVWMCASPAHADGGDGRLEVYWTDVEGGAATLVVTPAGESILIDTGLPGSRDPYRIFRTVTQHAKLERVDHLIVTHFDVDHFGGAADLSELITIDRVWDPGFPEFEQSDRRFEMLRRYRRAFGRKRTVLKPGDTIPLRQRAGKGPRLELLCLGAARKFVDAPGGAPENPACDEFRAEKKKDTSQNGESTALLFRLGRFEFLDCGDLTWNQERRLVCPTNLVGECDVFQVNHHGLDSSNNPVLIQSVAPRVAVMNNGNRKGCRPQVVETLRSVKSIRAIYQMHRNIDSNEVNTSPELIANHPKDCHAEIIRLRVEPNGERYALEIPSTGHRRVFESKE